MLSAVKLGGVVSCSAFSLFSDTVVSVKACVHRMGSDQVGSDGSPPICHPYLSYGFSPGRDLSQASNLLSGDHR